MGEKRLLETRLEEGAQRALQLHHVDAVGQRHRVTAIGDSAHQLVALVGNEKERELAQQVTPATRQASAETTDEAGYGVNETWHGGGEIVDGNASDAGPRLSPREGSHLPRWV
jgi:hypothetical protein